MDAQRLFTISGLSSGAWRARRVQRQIHGQSNGVARLIARHAVRPFAAELSQFLLSAGALAILRIAACGIPTLRTPRAENGPCSADRASRGAIRRNGGFICGRYSRRPFGQAETATAEIFLRSCRLGVVRAHHAAAGILSD